MPWANEQSAQVEFQRERLRKATHLAARREEWNYGLFAPDEARVLGAFGLTTRRGPGTLEIGYWLHRAEEGRGYATTAAGALAEIALGSDGVRRVLICCDEANTRSAAVPKRLGFALDKVQASVPEAPAETGRLMFWARDRPESATS
jgi:RimJ/RimL family protein N-acetyltransferase